MKLIEIKGYKFQWYCKPLYKQKNHNTIKHNALKQDKTKQNKTKY